MRTTPAEREAGAKERFHNEKHRYLHQSSMMYGMQYGVNLCEFVKFIDPIKQFRVLGDLTSRDFLKATNEEIPVLNCYNVTKGTGLAIVNRAEGLLAVPRLFNNVDDHEYAAASFEVYLNKCIHAPIIINMGYSTSLTAFESDFVGPIEPIPEGIIKGLMGTNAM